MAGIYKAPRGFVGYPVANSPQSGGTVVIDNTIRNMGYGSEMLKLAVKYAFEIAKADAVQLNVFPENERAKKCYLKVGFKERTLTENAFSFKDESWGRCNMVITK